MMLFFLEEKKFLSLIFRYISVSCSSYLINSKIWRKKLWFFYKGMRFQIPITQTKTDKNWRKAVVKRGIGLSITCTNFIKIGEFFEKRWQTLGGTLLASPGITYACTVYRVAHKEWPHSLIYPINCCVYIFSLVMHNNNGFIVKFPVYVQSFMPQSLKLTQFQRF